MVISLYDSFCATACQQVNSFTQNLNSEITTQPFWFRFSAMKGNTVRMFCTTPKLSDRLELLE